MRNFIMWFYGVDAAQAAAREPVAWFALIVTIAALLTWGWCSISYTTKLEQKVNLLEERVRRYRWECERLELEKQLKRGACQMMGAAAVAVVVVCTAMYTIFEVIERRKRKKFAEDIRRYIQNHKGEWTSDNQDLR